METRFCDRVARSETELGQRLSDLEKRVKKADGRINTLVEDKIPTLTDMVKGVAETDDAARLRSARKKVEKCATEIQHSATALQEAVATLKNDLSASLLESLTETQKKAHKDILFRFTHQLKTVGLAVKEASCAAARARVTHITDQADGFLEKLHADVVQVVGQAFGPEYEPPEEPFMSPKFCKYCSYLQTATSMCSSTMIMDFNLVI